MRAFAFFVAAVALFCFGSVAHAARIDTSFHFSTMETPHFSIHFHQGLEKVAQKTAVVAEEVHRDLVKEFIWQPWEKTQLVLIDNSDFTNGMAVTIPYNTIYVQVVPPSVSSTLGEYDDWLRALITHEYAHILTSDPSRGYWRVTRSIFGKPLPIDAFTSLLFLVTAPPNTFMPRWWHEGMGTAAESIYTGVGRGKSTYYDMVFRSAVAEDNLPRVDEINGDVPYWPSGNLPYMFGYRLQRHIRETYGEDALGKLTIAHSGRFPYAINAPPAELTGGLSYSELYAEMIAAVKKEQSAKLAILSAAPFTSLTHLPKWGENLTNPRFSPDGGRLAFNRRDPHDHNMIWIADSTGSKVLAKFDRQHSDGSICWSPDGKKLYFTQAEVHRGFDVYQDLYLYDIRRDSIKRLTKGKRLGEVEISPDGSTFAAVASSRGSQNLALIEAGKVGKKGAARFVTHYEQQRVSFPRWSPDGGKISYAVTDNAGRTEIRIYNTADGSDQAMVSVGYTAGFPVWSRDGSSIFYISDETGVFNLFAFDLKERKSYQVSHLLTGALQPEPSPDGRSVAVSYYTSRGFGLAMMPAERAVWLEKRGPALPLRRAVVVSPLPNPPPPGAGAGDAVATAGGAPASSKALARPTPPLQRKDTEDATSAPADTTQNTAAAQGLAPSPGGGGLGRGESIATPDGSLELPPTPHEASRYRALKTVYPHFWLPRVWDDGSDAAVVGAFTAGADVLGYNSYVVTADYSPDRSRGYLNLIYQNDYLYPTFTVRAHSQPFLYSDLYERGDYWERNQGVSIEASVPLNFLESSYRFHAGYQLLDQKALSDLDSDGSFNGVRVFQGRRDNVFAGVSFDNVLRYPWSVSSEEGRRISFLYRYFGEEVGSDQDVVEYSARYEEFLRLPGAPLKHHVLYLRAAGALADGDLQFGQQAFQLGGTPSDLNPYPLRGYSSRSVTGKYVATGTVEYRAPIYNPLRGFGTLPFFFEKVHGALFVDAGRIWDDDNDFETNEWRVGAGAEARLDLTLGYWAKVTPAVGFAHGFGEDGENQIYFTVYIDL